MSYEMTGMTNVCYWCVLICFGCPLNLSIWLLQYTLPTSGVTLEWEFWPWIWPAPSLFSTGQPDKYGFFVITTRREEKEPLAGVFLLLRTDLRLSYTQQAASHVEAKSVENDVGQNNSAARQHLN